MDSVSFVPYNMKDLIENQDWIRALVMVACAGYLFNQIYIKTDMLLRREMGFTEVAVDSDVVQLPSITFCPGSQAEYLPRYIENITSDYLNLPRLEDMLDGLHQKIKINKYE